MKILEAALTADPLTDRGEESTESAGTTSSTDECTEPHMLVTRLSRINNQKQSSLSAIDQKLQSAPCITFNFVEGSAVLGAIFVKSAFLVGSCGQVVVFSCQSIQLRIARCLHVHRSKKCGHKAT